MLVVKANHSAGGHVSTDSGALFRSATPQGVSRGPSYYCTDGVASLVSSWTIEHSRQGEFSLRFLGEATLAKGWAADSGATCPPGSAGLHLEATHAVSTSAVSTSVVSAATIRSRGESSATCALVVGGTAYAATMIARGYDDGRISVSLLPGVEEQTQSIRERYVVLGLKPLPNNLHSRLELSFSRSI